MTNETEKTLSLEEIATQMAREIEAKREAKTRMFGAVRQFRAKLARRRR